MFSASVVSFETLGFRSCVVDETTNEFVVHSVTSVSVSLCIPDVTPYF